MTIVAADTSVRKAPKKTARKRPAPPTKPRKQPRAPSDRPDLAAAASAGFVLLPDATCADARLEGRVIRFNPAMPDAERAAAICGVLADEARERIVAREVPTLALHEQPIRRASALGLHYRVKQAIGEGEAQVSAEPLSRRSAVIASAVIAFGVSGADAASALCRAVWSAAFDGVEGGPSYSRRRRLHRIALCMEAVIARSDVERDVEEVANEVGMPLEGRDEERPDFIALACFNDLLRGRGHSADVPGNAWELVSETFHYLERVIEEVDGASAARTADALALDFLERLALVRLGAK